VPKSFSFTDHSSSFQTAPPLAYAQDDINYILALNEVIYVDAYSYIYWETGNAVAYFVNSNDELVYFGTTWLAENLQAVYIDSLENLGVAGEFYSFAFPYYEIGLEAAGDPLPLYIVTIPSLYRLSSLSFMCALSRLSNTSHLFPEDSAPNYLLKTSTNFLEY
jgi:hypothetical protein